MSKRVYLCGPITGLSYGASTDWRKLVASKLSPDLVPVSPMRGKEYLASEEVVKDQYDNTILSMASAITMRDRNDVMTSDIILANFLGAKQVSIGSVIELGWADAFRKPIVLVAEPDNIHRHSILDTLCGFKVSTLDEAILVVRAILSEEFARQFQ